MLYLFINSSDYIKTGCSSLTYSIHYLLVTPALKFFRDLYNIKGVLTVKRGFFCPLNVRFMEGIKKAAAKYHLMVFTAAFYAK